MRHNSLGVSGLFETRCKLIETSVLQVATTCPNYPDNSLLAGLTQ